MFQAALIAEMAQGISLIQPLCRVNKVCQTLTENVEKIEPRVKRSSLDPLHGSARIPVVLESR